jgi:hypothetical protein
VILLIPALAFASPQQHYDHGVQQLANGDPSRAASSLVAALDQGGVDPSVYHALGNALYRQGNGGHAAAAWQRGLYLAPFDVDLRYNLVLVDASHPPLLPLRWGLWLLSASITAALALYLAQRRASGAVFSFLASAILSAILCLHSSSLLSRGLMVEESVAYSAVGGGGDGAFSVPSGSSVNLLQEYGGEVQVLYGERKGWVPKPFVITMDPEAPFSLPVR